MADNKSSEGNHIASKEALAVRKKIIEWDLDHCKELTPEQVDTVIDLYRDFKKSNKNIRSLTVDVECTNAIKGLKAVQREARKTVAALKEIEEYKRDRSDNHD
ncbi:MULTISPECIES: hypothetical protein [unclassified Oceanobacillus]|uniref:hypothetical protein n=1 Tax=unclassified Oceanobacillus TaxID=2630292 RepID=UPI001BEC1AD8|nr:MULTISPECIES: hypothetical protein [unclassified Oceanobacillus]MBT2600959.1 hypothetical protein [Oceanobacillus sp. ISL-74]MBT2653590.1 hypothetical protein [Oceanobacillus sp. ISL-73]